MNDKEYILNLNAKEIRLLLSALGKRPFEEVYELIEKIVTTTSDKNNQTLSVKNNKKK